MTGSSGTGREDDPLLSWRDEFPILEDSIYLVSHSMGAMPKGARQRVGHYLDLWGRRGVSAWEVWYGEILAHGNRIGSLFGAQPDCVALHQNLSVLLSAVLSCLHPDSKRNKVVYTDVTFPTSRYIVQSDPRLRGCRAASPDGATVPTESFVRAVDDETLAVIIDHGIYVSGALQDVPPIVEAARRHGAISIVDAYQTVGVVPIDVKAWGCDVLLGGSHKWLCGGPGTGFMYMRPDLIPEMRPAQTGWMAHRDPFGFAGEMQYPDNALRFIGGTASIAAYAASREGVEILNRVGVEAVRAKSLRQTARILEHAAARGFAARTPREPASRGGVVCFDFENAHAVEQELARRRCFCDYRPGCGLRVSGHFYTSDQEIDGFFDELDRVRAK